MKKHIVVIGGGLGGISAAISLASKGYQVTLCEKNGHIGGKLNVLKKDGFSFDLGPSILTLPHIFEALFTNAGKHMHDYVRFVPVHPHWRNFFEDGTQFDLVKDLQDQAHELKKIPDFSPTMEKELLSFLAYSKKQYDMVDSGYFQKGLDNLWQFLRYYGFFKLAFRIDHRKGMSQAIHEHFSSPYLRAVFEYFIKYVGSSAIDAPGFMNLMPTIQYEYDLWYVEGGMIQLGKALERLALELGVNIRLNTEVLTFEKDARRLKKVQLNTGETLSADYFVSNMEVLPAYEKLLHEDNAFMKKLERFEPACSGLVLHLGTNKIFPQLAHHNFFYSHNQHKHFDTVFKDKALPSDPTIYLVAPTRTDPSQAPQGCDNIKILPHIPYLQKGGFTQNDLLALKERVLDKLERMGLNGLRKSIVVEDMWTPFDIESTYYSNKGSIYGVVSDWKKNHAFKAPKRSTKYPNLFFVGGSVNPGGGMPMVVLCGQNVAKDIVKLDQER